MEASSGNTDSGSTTKQHSDERQDALACGDSDWTWLKVLCMKTVNNPILEWLCWGNRKTSKTLATKCQKRKQIKNCSWCQLFERSKWTQNEIVAQFMQFLIEDHRQRLHQNHLQRCPKLINRSFLLVGYFGTWWPTLRDFRKSVKQFSGRNSKWVSEEKLPTRFVKTSYAISFESVSLDKKICVKLLIW